MMGGRGLPVLGRLSVEDLVRDTWPGWIRWETSLPYSVYPTGTVPETAYALGKIF